jgi:hypothetical protein
VYTFSKSKHNCWLPLLVATIVIASCVFGSLYENQQNNIRLHDLQKRLNGALIDSNDAVIIADTTRLIHEQNVGNFNVSSQNLANYYLDRGTSRLNLKQYKGAITDLKTAAKLDSDLRIAALQGEVIAGYGLGERKQLVPILQNLEKLAGSGNNTLDITPAQYQGDIQAIENNQEPIL